MSLKIYLAGPDVFRPDALAYGAALKQLCARHGFTGLFPLDSPAVAGHGPEAAAAIYRNNLALIQEADLLMANLNLFRGSEPDSGTAFEVGYACALGKRVWAYTEESTSLVQQIAGGAPDTCVPPTDAQGYLVEDFGLNLNLMLACSTTVVQGDANTCLHRIAETAGLKP